jgi:RNA polymerase sigma-70 factor (ECF subfamily)
MAPEYVIEFTTDASTDAAKEAAIPPKIVRTIPETGAMNVDWNLTELIAEFDRDMNERGYSWVQRSAEEYPETTGKPFWRTSRICVLPVKLEPGHSYWIGLNVAPFQSFKSADGAMAEQYILQFKTAADEE